MESRAKLFGHPVHQTLIVFPLGLLAMSVIFDVIRLVNRSPTMGVSSYNMIAAGVIAGLVAAVFGLIDWLAIPRRTRAKTIGAWHGIGNVAVLLLFAASWWIRRENPANPPLVAFVIALVGAGLSFVTGWLGGELVDRLGIGVDEGANPNAPSSLSGPVRAMTR